MAQADAERGERIKWLRDEKLHLTQEAMADKVGITLRGYQEWEAGGGIKWENAKKLAKIGGVEADWIMSGDRGGTPDLSLGGQSQLDHIEENQRGILAEVAATRVEIGALATQVAAIQRTLARIAKSEAPVRRSRSAK